MATEKWRGVAGALVLALLVGVGCNREEVATKKADDAGKSAATKPANSNPGTTAPAAGEVPVTPPPILPEVEGPSLPAATQAASGDPVNPLFTLPPSQGPAPHKFEQVTLLRSGPSGDLEMQVTGDGIYRIRDHGRGKSYSGNGKLSDEQIADWATTLKQWESLKETYTTDAKDADKLEIIHGGKKVTVTAGNPETPKPFAEIYKKLMDLNEQSKKEAGVN